MQTDATPGRAHLPADGERDVVAVDGCDNIPGQRVPPTGHPARVGSGSTSPMIRPSRRERPGLPATRTDPVEIRASSSSSGHSCCRLTKPVRLPRANRDRWGPHTGRHDNIHAIKIKWLRAFLAGGAFCMRIAISTREWRSRAIRMPARLVKARRLLENPTGTTHAGRLSARWWNQGGSKPPGFQGWQRSTRRIPLRSPRTRPYFFNAPTM